MLWANLFHVYQPPYQKKSIVKKVAKESYYKIFNILKKHPQAKITLNINACLTEQLIRAGFQNIIQQIKDLARKNQIELVESAKYHSILPLLPSREIIHQIKLNHQTNKKYFGPAYHPKGFFLPEMCYSEKVARIIKELGYQWIILDEIAFSGQPDRAIFNAQYKIQDIGLSVVFRNRGISDLFFTDYMKSTQDFFRCLKKDKRNKNVLITAMDGENIGHHRKITDKIFNELLNSPQLITITYSELLKKYDRIKTIKPRACSWVSQKEELKKSIYYILWKNPKNPIHRLQWQLTNFLIKTIKSKGGGELLSQNLNSDPFWWASCQPWWQKEMIIDQSKRFLNILKQENSNPKKLEQAKKIINQIRKEIKYWEKEKLPEKISKAYLAHEPYDRFFGGKRAPKGKAKL